MNMYIFETIKLILSGEEDLCYLLQSLPIFVMRLPNNSGS